jgi:amino-acid N-acetyltransferase
MKQLTDLREMLRYVPQFRDKIFVIALDGAVVDHENFANLMLDIHLLRSLRIGVVLVHGASLQIRQLAAATGKQVSNTDGTGITDETTLDLAITAANRITHEILEGLATHDLRAAYSNALTAHPAGILKGVNHLWTGRVDRVDVALLETLLKADIIPVVPPLGCDSDANTYRLNSDTVAVDVARALHAIKLIYLAPASGVQLDGKLLRHLSVEEATEILKNKHDQVPSELLSKLEQGARAAKLGVPRVHIIDGREEEGLLAEVFSNEGIGTLIHANEYQQIRKALKKDVRAIHALIQAGVESDELLRRTRAEIERQIDEFYIFDVDRAPVGCCAVHRYPEDAKAEVACVYVDSRYENQGIGLKLVRFAEEQARAAGFSTIFCLSTQAVNYFVQKAGYQLGTPEDLPRSRREPYERSGRKSQVLKKKL